MDATMRRDGRTWIMAAYFPRGQQAFTDIKRKFVADFRGVSRNCADGMVFVTNQELTVGQRRQLGESVDGVTDIYHLERTAAVLDQPHMVDVRRALLSIDTRGQPAVHNDVTAPVDGSVIQSGSITGDVVVAVASDNATNVLYEAEQLTALPAAAFAPVAATEAPPRLSNLPSHPGLFVGRAELLDRLDAALARPGTAVVHAVHGLGGIGKSTLAAYWAANHAIAHNPIWWVGAHTPASLDAGLASLATALQPALSGVLPLDKLRERALQWLAAHDGWLVVLDNVTDTADIAPLLAQARGGRFLITSRKATGWHGIATPVVLDVLDQAEAVELLTRILRHSQRKDLDGADELCTELGCLPLAIEQVGAYCAETAISPRTYLDLLARYPETMFQATASGGDPERTIARIWRVTLDRLVDEPLAGDILRILAWYGAEAIPRSIIDGLAEPPALLRAIGRLAAFSMLKLDDDSFRVHRLVQAVTRTSDPVDPHRTPHLVELARGQAASRLDSATPDDRQDPGGWPNWRALLPHVEALADHIAPDADSATTATLFNKTGLFLCGQGAAGRAVPLFQRALDASGRLLGDDHRDTLASRNNLGFAYFTMGDFDRAVPQYEQALADRVRILGDSHPDTDSTRGNLALAHEAKGDVRRAVPLLEQVVLNALMAYGPLHPQTMVHRSNLASVYESVGEETLAVSLYRELLSDRERVLGENHPQTLITLNNLAYCYSQRGDTTTAIPMLERVLARYQQLLGDDHPHTIAAGNNLAQAYHATDDFQRSATLLETTVENARRVMGDDHPHTLVAINNLASCYTHLGDPTRAIPLLEQTEASSLRMLGADHRQTFAIRSNLYAAYEKAGKTRQAEALLRRALVDWRRARTYRTAAELDPRPRTDDAPPARNPRNGSKPSTRQRKNRRKNSRKKRR